MTISCKSQAVGHKCITQVVIEKALREMKKYAIVAKPRCLYLEAALTPVSLDTPSGFIDPWYKCLCPFYTKYGLPISNIGNIWEL